MCFGTSALEASTLNIFEAVASSLEHPSAEGVRRAVQATTLHRLTRQGLSQAVV